MKIREALFISFLNGGKTREEVKEFQLYSDPLQKLNELRRNGLVVLVDGKFQIKPKAFNQAREIIRALLRFSISSLKLLEEFHGYTAEKQKTFKEKLKEIEEKEKFREWGTWEKDGRTRYEGKVDGERVYFGECCACGKVARLHSIRHGMYCKECYEDITSSPKYQRDGEEVLKKFL